MQRSSLANRTLEGRISADEAVGTNLLTLVKLNYFILYAFMYQLESPPTPEAKVHGLNLRRSSLPWVGPAGRSPLRDFHARL